MDVMDAMIRNGVSMTRSLELTVQWQCILRTGPVHPVTQGDLQSYFAGGIGKFRGVVGSLQCWLSEFIHRVVGSS